jgi:hypothetical protein
MSELLDLLERYRRGAELLAMASTGAAGPVLDFKAEGHPLSVRQIVCHLADLEAVTVVRLRQVIAEENPTLPGVNGDLWAEKLDYKRRKLSVALETFRRLRADNHDLLKELPESDFDRPAVHAEMGAITLKGLVLAAAEHVEEHVREMQAVRAVYKDFRAKELAAQGS